MTETAITFHARGMHCHGCERVIEAAVRKLGGVRRVAADYPTETVVVDYDPEATSFGAIRDSVEKNGYRVVRTEEARRSRSPAVRFAVAAAALAGLAALILFDTRWISAEGEADVARHMSLGLIFLLGLLTGFHCIGMCGGFVVSYVARDASLGRSSILSHLAYGAGKTLSYTTIGAAFGWFGAFIAFTPMLRGFAGVAAGAFLIVFGLNMLGLFAPLRRFRLGLPPALDRWVNRETSGRHQPFVIGLLNGLMIACGPLQAMYVMAAGTGSPVEGAKTLFVFGLGTLPVMLAFGALASVLSSAVTHRLLTASGVIVVALGAVMINRGLILTGSGADLASLFASLQRPAIVAPLSPANEETAPPATQTIEMTADRLGYQPDHFTLQRGVPVKWVINATEITTCNNRILVPALKLEFNLKPGLQTIEFTPQQTGVIPWSCWMGMMRGSFEVVDSAPPAPATPSPQAAAQPTEAAPPVAEAAPIYRVGRGDTLRAIAKKLYGEESRWRDIAAANPSLNPKKLRAGQTLNLPPGAKP
ncbi:sulfite exporter TauE/SafE family protein [Methylocystis sp. 9N]|uniref:Sulfite exporter TauE/SafE family protein n=1 Tax=Methylocystis borbori TaxID=3118750 RepID=A0ABU7XK91_9HYPH